MCSKQFFVSSIIVHSSEWSSSASPLLCKDLDFKVLDCIRVGFKSHLGFSITHQWF